MGRPGREGQLSIAMAYPYASQIVDVEMQRRVGSRDAQAGGRPGGGSVAAVAQVADGGSRRSLWCIRTPIKSEMWRSS
jgi:hypothetical protein